jgi:hypothetical protein
MTPRPIVPSNPTPASSPTVVASPIRGFDDAIRFSKVGLPQDNNAVGTIPFGTIIHTEEIERGFLGLGGSDRQSPLRGEVYDTKGIARSQFRRKDPVGVNLYDTERGDGISYISDRMLSEPVWFKYFQSSIDNRASLTHDPGLVFESTPVAVYNSKDYRYTIKVNPDYLTHVGVKNHKGYRLHDFYNVHLATEGDKSLLDLHPDRPIGRALLGFSDFGGMAKGIKRPSFLEGFQDYDAAPKVPATGNLVDYVAEKNAPPPPAPGIKPKTKAPKI